MRIFGLSIPQEYVCLASENLDQTLSTVMTSNFRSDGIDVTGKHIFLGYKPLVFALSFASNSTATEELKDSCEVEIEFRNTNFGKGDVVARLRLKKVKQRNFDETTVFFFQGVGAEHRFLSRFHQLTNLFRDSFSGAKEGNVRLSRNLHDQVRIAYSIPRKISIITVSDGDRMNLFPTDLHGLASEKIYLGSLRIGGKANEQVEQFGVLALSDVASSFYRDAYELGKNHMRNLSSVASFRCHSKRSVKFGLPLPASTLYYRELRLIDSFDIGIHRIQAYEILHDEKIGEGEALTHIHQYYAQWRIDHHHATEFLFR